MLDLDALQQERDEACIDKSDLFDFYNHTWDALVGELQDLRTPKERDRALVNQAEQETVKAIVAFLYGFERGIDHSIIAELEEKFGKGE